MVLISNYFLARKYLAKVKLFQNISPSAIFATALPGNCPVALKVALLVPSLWLTNEHLGFGQTVLRKHWTGSEHDELKLSA